MEVSKVVFLGLDNAGKSTILNIISKKYSAISNLAPTKSIERKETQFAFGYTVMNWDIPGQQQFREELTFKDTRTLRDANVLIMTIDVQDIERTALAIDYFQRVLEKIEAENLVHPIIGVFIHKMDPDVREDVNILRNAKRIQDELADIAAGYNINFFLSSMFVEATIFIGFSSVFRKAASRKKQEDLRSVLQFFVDELLLNAILVVDKNDFIINHFERKMDDFNLLQDFVYTLNAAYKNAKDHNLELEELRLVLKNITFLLMPVPVGADEVLVVASSHDPEVSLVLSKSDLSLMIDRVIK